MLSKGLLEIKEHLEKAQNPLFFFDNDNDGLVSFLLLQRYLGRGRGVAIKSFPELNVSYFKKVEELNPDYVFILDKPLVSEDFLKKLNEKNIPFVWIDHHVVEKPDVENYYNFAISDNLDEPVSAICYRVTNQKEDIWLALIGCISDCFIPDFYKDFYKNFSDYGLKNPKSAFELLYDSEIGKIARVLDFSLKDTTTNVVNMLRFMMRVKFPSDILHESSKTKQILKRYNQLNNKYTKLLERAREEKKRKLVYFQYGGELSLSSNLANQLIYEFPEKVIVVVYIKGDFANISIRGKVDVLSLTNEILAEIGGTGGGHKNATGAKISVSDLPKFKELIEEKLDKFL